MSVIFYNWFMTDLNTYNILKQINIYQISDTLFQIYPSHINQKGKNPWEKQQEDQDGRICNESWFRKGQDTVSKISVSFPQWRIQPSISVFQYIKNSTD